MKTAFYLEEQEYVALCDLLKLVGWTQSGGHAKQVIADGLVRRNGETETRKTAKIRAGETVSFEDGKVTVFQYKKR